MCTYFLPYIKNVLGLKHKCSCNATVTNKSCMKNVKDDIIDQSVRPCLISHFLSVYAGYL